jgi:hypothetical protein
MRSVDAVSNEIPTRKCPRNRMTGDKASQLFGAARELAEEYGHFQRALGAGKGDHRSNAYVKKLRARAGKMFGEDFSEKKICGATAQAVDYYFPDERTIVEVALGLPNPSTEFEKDVLKAIIAQEHGYAVNRLYFISRAGGKTKCEQAGRAGIVRWAQERRGIVIEVHDLDGKPRKRKARSKRRAAKPNP